MTTDVFMTPIDPTQVTNTYRGEPGCACGCRGVYVTPDDHRPLVLHERVDIVNAAIADGTLTSLSVWPDELIYEKADLPDDAVVRVYVRR